MSLNKNMNIINFKRAVFIAAPAANAAAGIPACS